MLPEPTAGLMLQLADLRQRFGSDHVRCSAHLRGMAQRLGAARTAGAPMTALDMAEAGALEALARLCGVCAIRNSCHAPLSDITQPRRLASSLQ